MPPKPTAARRRYAALRSALDDQLDALGAAPFAGPERPALALEACARAVLRAHEQGLAPHRAALKAVVRGTLTELAERFPGHALEVRVPPYGAVQCLEGPRHTRGTPPGVVETDPLTWAALATGELTWAEATSTHLVLASGARADLGTMLPLWTAPSALRPPAGPPPENSR